MSEHAAPSRWSVVACLPFPRPPIPDFPAGGLGGAGGQGESELQLQRRRIAERRKQLLRQLDQVCLLQAALPAVAHPTRCTPPFSAAPSAVRCADPCWPSPLRPAALAPQAPERANGLQSQSLSPPVWTQVRKTRAVQRAARRRSGKPQVRAREGRAVGKRLGAAAAGQQEQAASDVGCTRP